MSFEDIKGQDSALGVLRESLRKGRIFSNYLFTGPDGVGKAFAAKNFAKAINCRDRNSGNACSACLSCKKVDSGCHPDIAFVKPNGASSSIGIDEIRSVTGRASLKPYESKKKVFVIDDAHSMNAASSNAFLKTLEEPPGETIFILISPSEKAMLPTIVSRCHIVKFSAAPTKLVERILRDRFGISEDEAGSMGLIFINPKMPSRMMQSVSGALKRISSDFINAPSTFPATMSTGFPSYPPVIRFLKTIYPHLPVAFDAPTNATDLGSKSG